VNVRRLLAEADRFRGRRGVARLRHLIGGSDHPMLTRSEAEERFLALIRSAELPFRFHSSRRAFVRDRRRDADLQAAGFSVVRLTWRQVVNEAHAAVARTARALAR
jgi:hypothetical protein